MSTDIQARLNAYYAHPAAADAKRTSGASWISQEHQREADLLDYFKRSDNGVDDRNPASSRVELHHAGHDMAPPHRFIASWSGNAMLREEGLFITTPCTHGKPTFNTLAETTLTDNGMVKRSAVEGPKGVQVRTVVVDRSEPAKSYVEEFFISA